MSRIPEISDEKLEALAEKIKPVYRFPEGLYYLQPVDIKMQSFHWDPKPAEEATNLVKVRDITTYHTYGYYGFFKPSVAEVLAQIPATLHDQVVAFEIVRHPKTAADLNRQMDVVNEGYHRATTRLYRRA